MARPKIPEEEFICMSSCLVRGEALHKWCGELMPTSKQRNSPGHGPKIAFPFTFQCQLVASHVDGLLFSAAAAGKPHQGAGNTLRFINLYTVIYIFDRVVEVREKKKG